MSENKILKAFAKDETATTSEPAGPIGSIARLYSGNKNTQAPNNSHPLLGYVLKLAFEEVTIVTCDPWKGACGGVPRNSFIIIRLAPDQVRTEDRRFCDRLIMARITNSVPTPVDSDITQTIYQIHKAQANIDPITNKELQWSALKATVIGTFFDSGGDGTASASIAFGPISTRSLHPTATKSLSRYLITSTS